MPEGRVKGKEGELMLVKCLCGNVVSQKADRCPRCGHPIRRGFLGAAGGERALNIAVLIGLVLFCFVFWRSLVYIFHAAM